MRRSRTSSLAWPLAWPLAWSLAVGLPGCDAEVPSPEDENEDAEAEHLVSHEGEDCWEEPPQDCVDEDGAQGVELCTAQSWSRCFIEPCRAEGDTRVCSTTKESRLIERCVEVVDYGLIWGACAEDTCPPGEEYACELGPEGGELPSYRCKMDELGVTSVNPEDCQVDTATTPLVLAFDGEEPTFRRPSAAADFDVNGRDLCVAPDWPTAATPWLARDLDRSGSIEGGHELFGNGTRLRSGAYARHGFEALAELDSDGDGLISDSDEAWPDLLLWADVDGDRRADGWELLPLASYGVDSLSLDLHVDPRCDERGNCSRERSLVTRAGRLGSGASALARPAAELVDVYLACP